VNGSRADQDTPGRLLRLPRFPVRARSQGGFRGAEACTTGPAEDKPILLFNCAVQLRPARIEP
jgi:hypothetical protein